MEGIALTALLVHLFACQTMDERRSVECRICEVEYCEMKEFFDCWNAKPGVQTTVIPKAFNWIIKRKLKKEIKGQMCGETFILSIIDGMESISLLDYVKLDEEEKFKLEGDIARIAGYGEAGHELCLILSGKNKTEGLFSRLIFHSKESGAFIILKGKFSDKICIN